MQNSTKTVKTAKHAASKKTAKTATRNDIVCAGSLDISNVGELHKQLSQTLEGGQPIVMDASQVERADTAALQMLSAFCQAARTQGVTVTWREPSEVFTGSARLLGLTQMLGLGSM